MFKNPNAPQWRNMGRKLEPYVKGLHVVVAGSDEVGTGACAGPIVAAAVILPPDYKLTNVKDSKAYSRRSSRERAAEQVEQEAISFGIGVVSIEEVEQINSNTRSGYEAHRRAIAALSTVPSAIIVDGEFDIPGLPKEVAQYPSAKADATCISVSAASVVAKVFRDRLMCRLALDYPQYGWDENVGYLTEIHAAAVRKHGLTPLHRHYYRRKILEATKDLLP